jgi:hypothetical protein
MVCKGFLKGSVLCGGNSAVICEEILTNFAIGVDLASEIALVGGIFVTNEYDIARVLYHITHITTNTMVHILSLCDNVLTALGKDYHIITIGKLKGDFVLFVVGSQTLIVILCLFTLIGCFGFAILSHKVIDLLGFNLHSTTVIKVTNKVVDITLILPHFTPYKVIDSNGKFFFCNSGHLANEAVIHFFCHLLCHTAKSFLGVLIVEPLAEASIMEIVKPSLVAIVVKFFEMLIDIGIALCVTPQFVNTNGVDFLCTAKSGYIASVGGGASAVVYHRANEFAEVGILIFFALKLVTPHHISDSGLFGAGLDGVALDTIENACGEVKAIVAIYSVKVEYDYISFFAIGRHSG